MFVGHMCVIILLLALSGSCGRGKIAAEIKRRNREMGVGRYDDEALCLFLKRWLFWMAVCYCPLPLAALLEEEWLAYLGLATFLAWVIGGLIYAGVWGCFRKRG